MDEPSRERAQTPVRRPFLAPGVLVGALVPLAVIAFRAARGTLGADPVAIALNQLGMLALCLLLASLAATPARLVFGLRWPLQLRRMLGLLAFFYASLHFSLYLVVDQGLNLSAIFEDVTERRFITVGFCALLLLLPLAVTSTKSMVRRLGGARWRALHRLVYVAALLAVTHFVWRVKGVQLQPSVFALVVALLLAVRIAHALARRLKPRLDDR